MKLTPTQKQELVDILVTCSCEDTSFLENRIWELVELKGETLYKEWLEE